MLIQCVFRYVTIYAILRRKGTRYGERTNAPWETCVRCVELPLKELWIDGFSATDDHITFVGAVMNKRC